MKNNFLKKCLEIAIIIIGNAILAFGICAFITPHGIIVGGASGLGLNANDLKMISAAIVAVFLAIPYLKGKHFSKPVKKGGATRA